MSSGHYKKEIKMQKLTHITSSDFNQIAIYMEDELVEDIISMNPNISNLDFINKYLEIDNDFISMVNAVI